MTSADRRAITLLALGAVVGAMLAIANLRDKPIAGLMVKSELIARVNDVSISRQTYHDELRQLQVAGTSKFSPDILAHVQERIIEEELLVQRGLDIGLASTERSVRDALVRTMIRSTLVQANSAPLDEKVLREYYQKHRAYFGSEPRYQVRRLWISGKDEHARQRANDALAWLAKENDFTAALTRFGDDPPVVIPASLLPKQALRKYLGDKVSTIIAELGSGEVSDLLETESGFEIFQLVALEHSESPPFERVSAQVEKAWRRDQADQALRQLLGRLKNKADIQRFATSPQGERVI